MSWPPQDPRSLEACVRHQLLSVKGRVHSTKNHKGFDGHGGLCVLFFPLCLFPGAEPPSGQPSTATHTCLCNQVHLLIISSSPHGISAPLRPAGPAVLSPSVCWRFRNSFTFISILPVDLHHNLFLVCIESCRRP